MSYDICVVKKCQHCGHNEAVFDTNYTFNVSRMYQLAFNNSLGIKLLNEMSVQDARVILAEAIDYMYSHKEELEKLNPANGWGDYNGALEVLVELYTICVNNKEDFFVEVCW